jgi:hypothetical protein
LKGTVGAKAPPEYIKMRRKSGTRKLSRKETVPKETKKENYRAVIQVSMAAGM